MTKNTSFFFPGKYLELNKYNNSIDKKVYDFQYHSFLKNVKVENLFVNEKGEVFICNILVAKMQKSKRFSPKVRIINQKEFFPFGLEIENMLGDVIRQYFVDKLFYLYRLNKEYDELAAKFNNKKNKRVSQAASQIIASPINSEEPAAEVSVNSCNSDNAYNSGNADNSDNSDNDTASDTSSDTNIEIDANNKIDENTNNNENIVNDAASTKATQDNIAQTNIKNNDENNDNATKEEELTNNYFQIIKSLNKNFGFQPKLPVLKFLRQLNEKEKTSLKNLGVYSGAYSLYIYDLIKPKKAIYCSLLSSLENGYRQSFDLNDVMGKNHLAYDNKINRLNYLSLGYNFFANHAIRMDITEKLNRLIKKSVNNNGYFVPNKKMVALLGCDNKEIIDILLGLGYEKKLVDKTIFDSVTENSKDALIEEDKFEIFVRRKIIKQKFSKNNKITYQKQIPGKDKVETFEPKRKNFKKKPFSRKFDRKNESKEYKKYSFSSDIKSSPFDVLKNLKDKLDKEE